MAATRLTPTSYIILGLLEQAGTATPYELKRVAATSLANFWLLQHAQFYTEPERLTGAGYLTVERERHGRRRKLYSITSAGKQVLAEWRAQPTGEFTELRDPGLLKLFLGAKPAPLAEAQLETHRAKLQEYEALRTKDTGRRPRGQRLALDAGIAHEREWVRFWSGLAEE